jgi:hypothetical protein
MRLATANFDVALSAALSAAASKARARTETKTPKTGKLAA